MADTIWTVPGVIVSVHDGDTATVDCDLGWNVTMRSSVRIDGLACAEISTAKGKKQRDYARTILIEGHTVTVVSKKLLGTREKYGRVLADLILDDAGGPTPDGKLVPAGSNYAQVMIAAGMGVAWDGKGKQPHG